MAENVVHVPRGRVVRLLGLPADVTDADLQRELSSRLAQIEAQTQARRVSAAEQQACAEDRRIVAAAVAAGKISHGRVDFWCDALERDRENNRAVLASLAPAFASRETLSADADMQRVHKKVLARLGVPTQSPRAVDAAAGFGRQPGEALPPELATPDLPPPVTIRRGKPVEEWSQKERDDALQRRLGQRFWPGTKPPPPGDQVYLPSPNDPYQFNPATGQWEWKPNDHARSV